MQLNRLLEMTLLLMNQKTLTARALAERFGVSVRTVYRDIDLLSASGVPVYTSKGNGGGISLIENFSLQRTMISPPEREHLLAALKAMQGVHFPEAGVLLEKLQAVFRPGEQQDWIEVDLSGWGSRPGDSATFTLLRDAILGHRVVSCTYANAGGTRHSRLLEPLRLIFRGHGWYLWAFCRYKQALRLFRVSRMRGVTLLPETFTPVQQPIPTLENSGAAPSRPPVELLLRVLPGALYRVCDDFDDDAVQPCPDGTYQVRVSFPEDAWVYSYLLSFGSQVEVLAPGHVREALAQQLKDTLKKYEPGSQI